MGSGALSPRSLPDSFSEEKVKEMLPENFQDALPIFQKLKDANGNISKENFLNYKDVFFLFDNEHKSANIHQLEESIKKLGYELLPGDIDDATYKSGTIPLGTFYIFLERKLELVAGFEKFDKNHDGQIDIQEIVETMKEIHAPVTKEEAEELVKSADINGDGTINLTEFNKMVNEE